MKQWSIDWICILYKRYFHEQGYSFLKTYGVLIKKWIKLLLLFKKYFQKELKEK